jgi:hypothetical protein
MKNKVMKIATSMKSAISRFEMEAIVILKLLGRWFCQTYIQRSGIGDVDYF